MDIVHYGNIKEGWFSSRKALDDFKRDRPYLNQISEYKVIGTYDDWVITWSEPESQVIEGT